MATRRLLFALQILALWLLIAALIGITLVALVASSARSDCSSLSSNATSPNITIGTDTCTLQENMSAVVHHHASYFQSAHIIIVQTIAASCLLIFKPSLWAMTWSALESSISATTGQVPVMKMAALQNGVALVGAPGLMPAILYARAAHSVKFQIIFVSLISLLSLLSPIAVSPIYRSHNGPATITSSLVVGGGVGPDISVTLNMDDPVPNGVAAGRALLNAGTVLNSDVMPAIYDITVAPFLLRDTIQAIYHTQVETVVARNVLDCGPSAPSRLVNGAQDLVTISPTYYFAANQAAYKGIQPLFAGQELGPITNDPQVTAVYLNASVISNPGSVAGQTSIIFLAANGTLEGAQQTITSPTPTSRINSVDVLVCTSTTTLEISDCTINNGVVTNCSPIAPSLLPAKASTSSTGGVELYIKGPKTVATILSASAVTAFYNLGERLPMYNTITDAFISSETPPLSFLTVDTVGDLYHIPLTYITNVLFGKTAQGLVQGMVTEYQVPNIQEVQLNAMFGTSKPVLVLIMLALVIVCALGATLASTVPRSARRAAALDVARLMAISRNPQLDPVFDVYADRNIEMHDEVMNLGVGYGWVEGLKRRALIIETGSELSDAVSTGSHSKIGGEKGASLGRVTIPQMGAPNRYPEIEQVELRSLMTGNEGYR